jgi:hypothetical protein
VLDCVPMPMTRSAPTAAPLEETAGGCTMTPLLACAKKATALQTCAASAVVLGEPLRRPPARLQ